MKRIVSVVVALIFIVALACPVFATEGIFVPSISEKKPPVFISDEEGYIGEIRDKDGRLIDKIASDCLIITAISDLKDQTDLSDAQKLLLEVYEKLLSGEMQMPVEKLGDDLEADEIVIRDLVDISWLCVEHPEMVAPIGIVLRVTLDLGVAADEEVHVMTYKRGEWNPIVDYVNNGDGTVTCTFEDLCPVAFMVGDNQDAPDTGDALDGEMMLWGGLMIAAAAGVVTMLALRRKNG